MHCSFFVMSEELVTRCGELLQESDLPEDIMYGFGYDYWQETDLESEVRDWFSKSDFLDIERMEVDDEDCPDEKIVQIRMTIKNRAKYMEDYYKRFRKAVDDLSDSLTLERLLDPEDSQINHLLYNLHCFYEDNLSIQFYSDYYGFESPEQVMRRSKDGDSIYITSAYDFHF